MTPTLPSPTIGRGTKGGRTRIANCGVGDSRIQEMGNKGFTLIEIIILIVMAGILLPAIVAPFVTGVKGSGKPEMVNAAMYLAHQKMEEFMKFDYGNGALNPTALTPYANADISGYQWQWSVTLVDSNLSVSATDVGYKQILVRVRDPESDSYEVYSVVTNFP